MGDSLKNPSLLDIDRSKVNLKGLKKRRKPNKASRLSHADVVEWNARSHMICKATRQRFDPNGDRVGLPGMRSTNEVRLVEKARRTLPPIEMAAYLAKVENHPEAQTILVNEVELIIAHDAKKEKWPVYGGEDKLRLLASIVVQQWVWPNEFVKCGSIKDGNRIMVPNNTAYAEIMKCTARTWKNSWSQYHQTYENYPQKWFQRGSDILNGMT